MPSRATAVVIACATAFAAVDMPLHAAPQEAPGEIPAQTAAAPTPIEAEPPAQAFAESPPIEDGPPPSTITLDRMDSATRTGVQVGLISVNRIDGWFMRSGIHGQYVSRDKRGGFYGQFPIAHFVNHAGPNATAVGAVEVGGYALPRFNSQLVLRFGLAVATGYDGAGAVGTHLFSASERLTDFLLTAPGYTTLRLSMSTVQQDGAVFFRGDFGLDIVVSAPNAASGLHLRANAAVGLHTSPGDLTIELVNFGATDSGAGASNSLFHTLTFGMRTRGTHQAHAGLVFPLDASLRGDVWILSLGYHYAASRSAP
jgi:hypothetical protein